MSDTGRKTGQTKQELLEQIADLENFLLYIKEEHNENWKQYLQQYDYYVWSKKVFMS